MQQLKDQVDDGEIDLKRLDKMKGNIVKISTDHYNEKFKKFVDRGAFQTSLELKVEKEMRVYHKEQAKKDEEKKKKQKEEREAKKAARENSGSSEELKEEEDESNDSSSHGSRNPTPPSARNSKQSVQKQPERKGGISPLPQKDLAIKPSNPMVPTFGGAGALQQRTGKLGLGLPVMQ